MHQLRIVCPKCRNGTLILESMVEGEARCALCGTSYPAEDGVIDLLQEPRQKRSLSQSVMEWKPFIEIYESKWFRNGPGFPFISGISFQEEYELITKSAQLKNDGMYLDLGCGTGIYSRPLAERMSEGIVVGLDLSFPMLRHAGSRARGRGLDNLLFIHGDATDLPFSRDEFDAVICCATIHLFSASDLLRTLREIHRVLKPLGRFSVSCLRNWMPGEIPKNILEWYSEKVGTYYRRPGDLQSLFEQAGFDSIECLHAERYWMVMSATKPEG